MALSIPLIAFVVLGAVLLLFVALFLLVLQTNRKLRTFMKGKNAASLEDTLAWLTEKTARTDETLAAHRKGLELIDARVKRSTRGHSLVRYDAYENTGGSQSFALCILDEHEDGSIICAISNRNHVGVYAKQINRGISDTALSKEEEQALYEAKKSLTI